MSGGDSHQAGDGSERRMIQNSVDELHGQTVKHSPAESFLVIPGSVRGRVSHDADPGALFVSRGGAQGLKQSPMFPVCSARGCVCCRYRELPGGDG